MLGAIAGDIIGSPYEFNKNNIKTTEFPLFSKKSRFTDDTIMTFAAAHALMNTRPLNEEDFAINLVTSMQDFGHKYPTAGYGSAFAMWLMVRATEPYRSYGNGSAMRVSPVAWAFDDLESVERFSAVSASVTHNHPEGIKGAQAVAGSIFLARTGSSKEDIRAYVQDTYHYDLSRTLEEIRPGYTFNATCQGSVPEAITAFLEGNDFEDTIRKAVSIGGDSDTIADIAGAIAEGFYHGVPEGIAQEVMTRLDDFLRDELKDWEAWLKC